MLKPRADRLLVEPMERPISSLIAVVNREKHCVGKVIAAGPGKADKKGRIQPLETKPGDVIRYGGMDYLQYPEYFDPETLKTYHIIQEADVCGIVESHQQAA